MGKPTPITETERQEIISLLQTGMTRNAIAKQAKRSPSTITRIAQSVGHDFLQAVDEKTQSSLTRAHEARSAFSAERRALAASKAQERLEEILNGFGESRVRVVNTPQGVQTIETLPDERGIEALARAAETLNKLILNTDRHDNKADDGAAAVDDWLRSIAGG